MNRHRNASPYELAHHCGGCGKRLTACRPAIYQATVEHREGGRVLSLKCWLCSQCTWDFHGFGGLLFASPKRKAVR
jgi:hypothetical protein